MKKKLLALLVVGTMSLSRKQDEYNAYIQNADYVFFLFLSHVGQYTKEEFEIAYAHFQQHQTPHILTYFYREHVADITSESGQFAEELSEKYEHYYCICNNLETIKLALLLQISQCFSTLKQVTLKNGRICLNDVDYLSMQQTDVIAGNPEYQKIVNELNTLMEKIELLANERPLQEDLLIEYNRQKDELLSRKLSIEEQSLAYMSKIYDDIIHGNISALKARLYRLIEQGRITEADQLLSMSSMEGFQNSHQQFFAQQQELAKECIDLYQQKISLTRMQKLTPDRVELIHTCYQKIKTIVELTGHFENTLIPYLHFLEETDQNPDEIKDLTAYIQWCYMKPGYQVPLKDYSDLYNELLHHYEANQNHKKASELLTQFVEKVESSSETDAFILCEACIRIQTHYCHIYPDLDTIRYWQKKALHYAEQSDSDYQKAICYKEMGGIAGHTENFDEMENYFSKSLTYMEQLYNNNPEKWISEYIKLCLMYGNIYQNKADELTESTNDLSNFVSNDENQMIGMENALCAFYEYPDEVHEFFDAMCEYKLKCIDLAYKYLKPDVIHMHDDWGTNKNLFFSPEIWREFVKPNEEKYVKRIHDYGMLYIHHSCGNVDKIIPELAEIGVDALEPVMLCNDIEGILQTCGDKITLMGGIDNQMIDQKGTSEDVIRAEVRRAMDTYVGKGRYIPYYIPTNKETLGVYIDEVTKYGKDIFNK